MKTASDRDGAKDGGKIPVFIVSGFLGAGKTTFLNDLLRNNLEATAVIINEFGETGLDHHFIEASGEGIIELSNGCLCCSVRGQLNDTLLALPAENLERVLIETTGLANPGPVIQSMLAHAEVSRRYRIDGLITIVDTVNVERQLERQEETRLQIALADMLVVSKTDMIEARERDEAITNAFNRLGALNPAACIELRDPDATSGELFLARAADQARKITRRTGFHGDDHHCHHDERGPVGIYSAVLRTNYPISRRALDAFCELLASAHGLNLLRIKGLVAIKGLAGPLVIHGVHDVFHEPVEMDSWPDDDHATRIVVITRNLEPSFIERLFAGFAGVPAPDTPDEAALVDNPLAIPGGFRRRRGELAK